MSVAITGVTGQDGQALIELIKGEATDIFGLTRSIQHAKELIPVELRSNIHFVEFDITSKDSVECFFSRYKPAKFFNFAALTSGSGMYEDPAAIGVVNGISVTIILEAIRKYSPYTKFLQASSREIFGMPLESPQCEGTIKNPRSPYGAAKLYADSMIDIYRKHYGLFACSAILYNHESTLRSVEFVTRKITNAAASIKHGLAENLKLGSLEIVRDWGWAQDYVRAMNLMLEQSYPDDFIISTGVGHNIRDFCNIAFARVGLDYRDFVIENANLYRPQECLPLIGSNEKAKKILGWAPSITFEGLVHLMVDYDLLLLNKVRSKER